MQLEQEGQLFEEEPEDQETLANEDVWKCLHMYFEKHGLVSHQIDSYEDFVHNLKEMVKGKDGRFEVKIARQYRGQEVEDINLEYYYVFEITSCYLIRRNIMQGTRYEEEVHPMAARLRDLTYSRQMNIDLDVAYIKKDKRYGIKDEISRHKYKRLPFFKLPIMVRSSLCTLGNDPRNLDQINKRINMGECRYDQGGYFILRGSEKVIVGQERMACNVVLVFKTKEPKKPWVAEIRSLSDAWSNPNVFSVVLRYKDKTPVIRCKVKQFNSQQGIPLFCLFRALGVDSDRDILSRIVYDLNDVNVQPLLEMLQGSLEEGGEYNEEGECLRWIGSKIKKAEEQDPDKMMANARHLLNVNILPHIGTTEDSKERKAYFLGYMVHRLLNASLGKTDQDDRDHYGKKRLDMSGQMMMQVFKSAFERFKKNAQEALKNYINGKKRNANSHYTRIEEMRNNEDVTRFFDDKQITNEIENALATGNWGRTTDGVVVKTGVAQTLKRETSLFATLSHLRRMNAPINAQMKLSKPRQLHNTHFGYICPAETPEGQKIGIVKNLSLMTSVSLDLDRSFKESLQKLIMRFQNFMMFDASINPQSIPKLTKILIDGNWIGFTGSPEDFMSLFKSSRSNLQGDIPTSVSINLDFVNKEIRIYTDAGRLMRPLFVVQNNELTIKRSMLHNAKLQKWEDLLDQKLVELLDVEEEEGSLIALDLQRLQNGNKLLRRYTHCEIHPSMMFGVCASVIPFANHNQGPRNTLQSAMGKQAMGLNSTNFNIRFDTLVHILHYPQKPLASSRAVDFITVNDVPIGINCVVAIACFTGYNQEDSIMINQYAIDRGFFRSVFFRTYKESQEIDENNFTESKIVKPQSDMGHGKMFLKLDNDGIMPPGTKVDEEEPIIGKELHIKSQTSGIRIKECSLYSRRAEKGVVDSVLISENQKGYKFVKVKVRSIRIPQIGDKFCSRHGQKGTCGMTYRQEDLPFSLKGVCPEMIINPHCIPSRMTIGHIIECLSSKLASIVGTFNDATPFSQISVNDLSERLHQLGWQRWGNEVVLNPYTGISLQMPLFMGPTYYQRLRHLVDDKMYARSRGPVTGITRQPTHGRSRKGGLRFGEMERDCIISHGTAKFLKERLYDVSDCFRVHVCSECGMFAQANLENQEFTCLNCKDNEAAHPIYQVNLPYAAKTLIQELIAMHIAPRLKFNQKKPKHEI